VKFLYEITPNNDFDSGRTFLTHLGSFWSAIYEGSDVLESLFQAQLDLYLQTRLDLLRMAASLSRFTTPAFDTKLWTRLTIYEDDLNNEKIAPRTYGSSTIGVFGNTNGVFGQTQTLDRYRFPADKKIHQTFQIMNRPIMPSVVMIEGIDFVVSEEGYVEFQYNPFFDSNFTVRQTTETDGTTTRRAIDLWLFNSSVEIGTLYAQFGYVLGLHATRSLSTYRELINAYWDSMQKGPTGVYVRQALAAICGVPSVINPSETVLYVLSHPERRQVVTDKAVYDFSPNATITVTAGQTVYQGDILCDAIRVVEGPDILNLTSQDLAAITIGPGFLNVPLKSTLTFTNDNYSVAYEASGGENIYQLDGVLGLDEDLATFWQFVHDHGKEVGFTLGNALRKVPAVSPFTPDPTPSEVVSTVNPMKFLVENLFKTGLIVCLVKTNSMGPHASLQDLTVMRQILPAHVAILYVTGTPAQYNQESSTTPPPVGDPDQPLDTDAFASGALSDLQPRISFTEA